MKSKITLIFIFLIVCQKSFSQNEQLFNRLRAINPSGTTFYNVDGINFSSRNTITEFNDKTLKKAYRENKIKKNEIKETDNDLEFENYKVVNEKNSKMD